MDGAAGAAFARPGTTSTVAARTSATGAAIPRAVRTHPVKNKPRQPRTVASPADDTWRAERYGRADAPATTPPVRLNAATTPKLSELERHRSACQDKQIRRTAPGIRLFAAHTGSEQPDGLVGWALRLNGGPAAPRPERCVAGTAPAM
ncbi:hypothetical protein Prum_002020 [Phytohabitans rumicis]|uniref:Uncharacterized protein n=1 Tax=Phytohabitans rumicis TaxID=1076125 RepID=A0A6V8KT06_9ACTN|nr:hypothetical protein Prum_002020 [Phytohabitans rumicis]